MGLITATNGLKMGELPSNANQTCVILSKGEVTPVECHSQAETGTDEYYYDGTTDPGIWTGNPNINDTDDRKLLHRGFLCETRPIHTIAFKEKVAGVLCVFPFR